jgi:hypothetical protein
MILETEHARHKLNTKTAEPYFLREGKSGSALRVLFWFLYDNHTKCKLYCIYWPHLGLKLKNPLDFSRSCDQHLPGSFLPSPRGNTLGTRLKPSYYGLITHIKMLSKIAALTYVYSEPSTDKLFLLCYVTLHKSVYTAGSRLYIFSKLPAI